MITSPSFLFLWFLVFDRGLGQADERNRDRRFTVVIQAKPVLLGNYAGKKNMTFLISDFFTIKIIGLPIFSQFSVHIHFNRLLHLIDPILSASKCIMCEYSGKRIEPRPESAMETVHGHVR